MMKPLSIQPYHKPKKFVYHGRWTNTFTKETGEIICTSYQAFNNNMRHIAEEEFRKMNYTFIPRLTWEIFHKPPLHLKHWRKAVSDGEK